MESGNRWAVVVVDFGGNELAKSPNIENSLAALRAALPGTKKLTVWENDAHTSTTTVSVHDSHVYVLPAGYRVARDIPYFETDYHASLGTRNYVMNGWNSHIAGKKTVYYKYHTGDSSNCSFDHAADPSTKCIAGAPQEMFGEVVPDSKGTLAPTVSRPQDCRKKDGSPLDYVCRLDIIYPSGEDVEATPVMVQAATQSPRMTNIGPAGRSMLVGMEFCGYTVAVYDYAYSPMARGDHYGYIDPYGTHGQNAAKTSRAAIRCIRYFAEQYGYNDSLIGVAGISKGTPTTAVLSTVNNKYVNEASAFEYDIDGAGPGGKVSTRDLWYEGDVNYEGVVTSEKTSVVQPYLTYEDGYNGKNIDGADVNYDVTRSGEISSEVNVVYCAAGDGINRIYKGDQSIILGGTNPNSGEETQHVPMVLSCGINDEYGCWDHWQGIQDRFTKYAENPFIAISMEDKGHDYPHDVDPMRDYDRYDAYMQFFHSILNPEYYTPQVAWMTPVDGATDVSVVSDVKVQLIKPAASLEAFVSAATVKDAYGNSVEGVWSTNTNNTSGLYTFIPTTEYMGGETYTVTVGAPVVAEATSKSFTVETAGFLRAIADTYVSESDKDGVFGTSKELYIDNARTYLATFNTEDFGDDNRASLSLPLDGVKSQTVSVYVLDGFIVDESSTCYNDMPALTSDKLIGTYTVSGGENTVNLLDIVSRVKSDKFTLAVKGSAQYFELDFEEYSSGTALSRYDAASTSQPADAPGVDDCYSPNYVWRTGGATSKVSVSANPSDSSDKVSKVTSGQTYNRIRWYNSFVKDKAYLGVEDIGKKFDISMDVMIKPVNSSATTKFAYALDSVGGTLATYTVTVTPDTWTTVTQTVTVEEATVLSNGEPSKRGVLSFTLAGTKGNTYYFDDITIKEQAPTLLPSREDKVSMTAYITTTYVEENGAVADTYVSAAQPDVALGNGERLLLNGGDNENIIFITYPAKMVKGKTDIQLTVPVTEAGASVNTEILLLDGYFVNEDGLTYNNMPDLKDAVSLGSYTLDGDSKSIEIKNAAEYINSPYFTVVLKTEDDLEVVYSKNFEDYAFGAAVDTNSNNATDPENSSYTYYYGYSADNVDSTRYIARTGGSSLGIGSVVKDPGNEANKAIDTSISKSHNYGGRIKFYNSVSDSLLTADSPLVGQTLRFTVRVKAGSQYTLDNKGTSFASAMLSAGTSALLDANKKSIVSPTVTVSDEWQTLTVDYTLRTADIKADTKANSDPAWGYPMFTMDFSSKVGDTDMTYLVDDITVVKLNSDGSVNRLDIASTEGANEASETIGLRARSKKDPIADTYVSETDKDGVFGLEETLYVDSKRTYLATFKKSDFVGAGATALNLPLAGAGSQTISVYVLDGFSVNEATTCYNNTPSITDDMLVGTYKVNDGGCNVDLTAIADVKSEYFTIAIKGSAYYYELNFEDYTSTTTVSEYSSDVVDATETDRSHMYGFAVNTSKLKPLTTRRGGNLSTRQIKADGDNMAFSVTASTSSSGYLKFYNFLNDDASDELAGKTFKYSAKVKLTPASNEVAEGSSMTPAVKVGILGSGENAFYGYQTTDAELLLTNEWQTVAGEYTVKASDIGKKLSSQWAPLKRFSYPMFGMEFTNVSANVNGKNFTYLVDDMVVSEEAPTAIASLESANGKKISVVTAQSIVADTYVSRANPNTAYGNEDTLRFGDEGGDKKALVLSFMNSVLEGSSYVDLNLNNGGEALENVSVYYVLDYLANESTLTWNTMPEYEENLLGVYDIGKGDNKIDLSALRGKLTGKHFTLVLRTESHSFSENYDSYPAGTTIVDNKKDNNVVDTEDPSRSHYHAFSDAVYNASDKTINTRRNGILSSRSVVVDASGNAYATATTGVSQNYDGSMKFYNSLNDELITKTSDIVGKTFRFTAKVKLDPSKSNLDKTDTIDVTAGVLTTYNNLYRSNKAVVKYDDIKDDWATLSVDYTVSADHIAEPITNSGVTNYSYPIFGLYFGDDGTTSDKHTYLIDDVTVVELVDGKPLDDVVLGSRESGANDVSFVSAINGSVTIIETTASATSHGDVISIVDGENTYSLLYADAGKLMFGDIALCDEIGNDYALGKESVKVVAIYDDNKGTVRFAVGDYLAYYRDGEGNISATFELPAIEGGVGDGAAFVQSEITATKLVNTTSEIIGHQINTDDNAVRFVAGVDAIYYNAAGFKLETASSTKTVGSVAVYSAVTADNEYVYASDYGYNLMSALAVNDIENGAVVKVTPFLRVGKNYIYGEAVCYKITTADGLKIEEVDMKEFGAECDATLQAVTIDGQPVVGFDPQITEYSVPATNVNSALVVAAATKEEATIVASQDGNVITVTVTGFDGVTAKTYTFTLYPRTASEVVNKNGADAIVTYVFDDGNTASASIVTALSEKYPSVTGSFAIITDRIATLSTIEGKEGDGLLEYEFDENGDYVYTKIDNQWNYWEALFAKYPAFEGVSHTHTHAYIGEDDNGGSFEYKNTAGASFTSQVFPIGNVRKEYYASNQILRDLGQRAYLLVGAGLTAGGSMIDYTPSYKALPQTSGAFIGKRTTVNSPTKPESMVNLVSDFVNEDNRYGVKAYMVQHYNASPTAPKSTSASDYSREACLAAGVDYWTTYIDKAVETGEWAAFCFHNVKEDTHTGSSGHFVYESQLDAVFKHSEELAKNNKVWIADFTDACLYVFERATSVVSAYVDGDGNVVVSLDDREDDEIFTMPLTVKVALPEGKTSASVDGVELTPFTEGGVTYVYVDIVPGNSITITA